MGWFDGLLGGGGGGSDYNGLLSGTGSIDYNKLMQQELANADNAKWAALAGALAEAGMPSRLPVPIGSAIGKAAAAFGGGENNSLLKILQIQKLATETQSLKELSELRKKLPDMYKGVLDGIVQFGGAPGAGQPDTPSGGGGGGGGTGGGGSIPAPTGKGGVTLAEAKQAALRAGFDENGANTIAAITVPESSLNPNAYNPNDPHGGSFGLTQINGVHPGAREAMGNIDKAMELAYRVSNGGTNFSPWSTYQKGMHKPYLAEAVALPGRSAEAAPSGAAAAPLPAAFNLPKFSGLLGDRTDAEQPSIQVMPDGGGLLTAGVPSAELRGDPSRVATSLGPPGSYRINSKGQPYSPELETMPPEAKARVAEAMRGIKERMQAGDGYGGGDAGGALPGDLAAGLTPGQGPLAIPRPAGLPPMPAATAAPPGGLLAPPQAPVAPPAGPGLLATPQAPAAAPVAPPAVRPGPSYMPQMPPGMNEQQMLALQVKIAQLRAQAALGGITGDPFSGLTDVLKNSPNAQRLAKIIEEQAKYYGPGANPELQRALEIEKNRAKYASPEYDPAALAAAEFGKRAGANPFVEREKTQATDEQIRADTAKSNQEFETVYRTNPVTNRVEEVRVRRGEIPSAVAPQAPGAPGAPGAPPASGANVGKPSYNALETQFANNLVDKSLPAAKGAAQALQFTGMAKDLLDKGVFTGAGAGLKLQVAKAAQLFPGDWSNERIANTETFIATQARQVASFLASGALGTGQSITDNDRKFAEGIAAGNIVLDEKTLRQLVDVNEKYARSALNQHNDSVRSFDPTAKFLIVPEPTPLELPRGGGGRAASGAPKPPGYNAIGPNGHRIYSVDGQKWYDATTNEPVK